MAVYVDDVAHARGRAPMKITYRILKMLFFRVMFCLTR